MIFYSLVAKGTEELVAHFDSDGNFITLTRRLLEKIPLVNAKRSFTFEKYNYHYIVHNGIIFLCLAACDLGMRIPFHFLEEIQARFKTYCEDHGGVGKMHKQDFEPFKLVLQDRMLFYSDPTRSESVAHLKSESDAVVEVFQKNIKETNALTSGFDSIAQFRKKLRYSNRGYRKIVIGVILLLLLGIGLFFGISFRYGLFMFKKPN